MSFIFVYLKKCLIQHIKYSDWLIDYDIWSKSVMKKCHLCMCIHKYRFVLIKEPMSTSSHRHLWVFFNFIISILCLFVISLVSILILIFVWQYFPYINICKYASLIIWTFRIAKMFYSVWTFSLRHDDYCTILSFDDCNIVSVKQP